MPCTMLTASSDLHSGRAHMKVQQCWDENFQIKQTMMPICTKWMSRPMRKWSIQQAIPSHDAAYFTVFSPTDNIYSFFLGLVALDQRTKWGAVWQSGGIRKLLSRICHVWADMGSSCNAWTVFICLRSCHVPSWIQDLIRGISAHVLTISPQLEIFRKFMIFLPMLLQTKMQLFRISAEVYWVPRWIRYCFGCVHITWFRKGAQSATIPTSIHCIGSLGLKAAWTVHTHWQIQSDPSLLNPLKQHILPAISSLKWWYLWSKWPKSGSTPRCFAKARSLNEGGDGLNSQIKAMAHIQLFHRRHCWSWTSWPLQQRRNP